MTEALVNVYVHMFSCLCSREARSFLEKANYRAKLLNPTEKKDCLQTCVQYFYPDLSKCKEICYMAPLLDCFTEVWAVQPNTVKTNGCLHVNGHGMLV